MPIVHIEPSDLSAEQAQRVLEFLNRASDAEQLNRDIEFPGEPDIGVRLGQRLLDARAALGGSFSQITQVRAVRLIGPERFTEICVAALGLDVNRWVELFYGGAPMAPQTETGLTVAVSLRPQPAWLGQPLALTVQVRDQGGSARMGVPVTIHTGLGRLVAMYGFSRIEGEAVTVLTGVDGSAELELLVEPSEPLSDIQQAALEHALGALDAAAPDPQKLEAGFAGMVDTYLQERSYNLRRAVDVWVRDQRDAMVDSVNATRWAFAWPVRSVLIQADALASDGSGRMLARAVATATWKNWVGAWLLALDAQLRRSGRIDEALAAASQGDDGKLLGKLLGQAQRFVAAQPGQAAEWLGRKQVQTAVRDLVSGDLSRFDESTRADLLNQLEVAAREVRPTSIGSYTLVTHTRKSLVKDIGQIGLIQEGRLQQLQGLAAEIDRQAAQVDAQAQQIGTLASSVQTDRQAVAREVERFNQQRGELSGQIDAFTRLAGQFNNDMAVFQRDSGRLIERVDRLQGELLDVNRKIAPLVERREGGLVIDGRVADEVPRAAPGPAAPAKRPRRNRP